MKAAKKSIAWTRQAEQKLTGKLQTLFGKAAMATIMELQKKGSIPAGHAAMEQLFTRMEEIHGPFGELTADAAVEAANQAGQETTNLIQQGGVAADFDRVNQQVETMIRDRTFRACESTLNRMTGEAKETLAQSYRDGVGIDDAVDRLRADFHSMQEYELERIARTEINCNQNLSRHVTMTERGIEYEQWWGADDDRSRSPDHGHESDHTSGPPGMHGQITRTGDRFSNGLRHPGDQDGPLEEFINCRCRAVPYFMPEGYGPPPGKEYFYEEDLVEIEPEAADDEEEEAREFYKEAGVDIEKAREVLGDDQAKQLMYDLKQFTVDNQRYLDRAKQTLKGDLNKVKDVWQNLNRDKFIDASYKAAFKSMPNPAAAETIQRRMLRHWCGNSASRGSLAWSRALKNLGLTKGDAAKLYAKRRGNPIKQYNDAIKSFISDQGTTAKEIERIAFRDYVRSQTMLKELGVPKRIKLYRGQNRIDVGTRAGKDVNMFQAKGIDSFSTNKNQAREFGPKIIEAEVPRSQIIATDLTNDKMWEWEVLFRYTKAKYYDPSTPIGGSHMVLKKKKDQGPDFTMEVMLAALYAERRRTGENHIPEDRKNRIIEEVKARLAAGEDELDLLDEYGAKHGGVEPI